jgi:hypothetical protein
MPKVIIKKDGCDDIISVEGITEFGVCKAFARWFRKQGIDDARVLWNKMDRPQWMRYFLCRAVGCEGHNIFYAHPDLCENMYTGSTFSDAPDKAVCDLIRKAIPWQLCFEPAVTEDPK